MLIWLTPPSPEPLQSAYRRQPIQDVACALPKAGWDNLCLVYFQANSLERNSARQCENLPVDYCYEAVSILQATANNEAVLSASNSARNRKTKQKINLA